MIAEYRLSATGTHDTVLARAIDNRPISFRSQALFHSIMEVKLCLAVARRPIQHITITHLRARLQTPDGGKFRLRGFSQWDWRGNADANTGNFSNLMIGCSPTWAYRGRPLKKCAGLRCI
jgi:hypothetical protein